VRAGLARRWPLGQVAARTPARLARVVTGQTVSCMRLLGVILLGYFQCLLHDFRNRVCANSTLLTVFRVNPTREALCPFARIARSATSGNVLTRNNLRVVDDVFPRCDVSPGAPWRNPLDHPDATIDARLIPVLHFLFEPVWDVPVVHVLSRLYA